MGKEIVSVTFSNGQSGFFFYFLIAAILYSIRVHNIIIHSYLTIVHRAWTTRSYVGTFCEYTYLFHLKEDARNHSLSACNNNIFVHDYIYMAINRLVFGPKTAISAFSAVYIFVCAANAHVRVTLRVH